MKNWTEMSFHTIHFEPSKNQYDAFTSENQVLCNLSFSFRFVSQRNLRSIQDVLILWTITSLPHENFAFFNHVNLSSFHV